MLLNRTITKKILEKLVHETFSEFGVIECSSLLDSLKLLGFYYATNAGISINLEDLKTPDLKEDCIKTELYDQDNNLVCNTFCSWTIKKDISKEKDD